MNLTGKTALITGASRGIGRAVTLELASKGASIVINYAGNEKAANEVKEIVNERYGQRAIIVKADVSKPEDVQRMFDEAVTAFGKVDILVNNAGITRDNLTLRMKEEEWDDVIDTNLKSVFLCSQKAIKLMMKEKYGRIVNISSVVGAMGNPGQLNYVASKSGVIGMTKTLAREVASRNITVNAVAPGFITTDMTDELNDAVREALLNQIPLKSFGTPEDIANAVSFLVCDTGKYITGQTIHVNGGMHM
jgi:3-oxoacyl-[acyl-carrier protein] reductase